MHKRKSSSVDPRVAKIFRRHGKDRDDGSGSDDEDGDGRRKSSLQSRNAPSARRSFGSSKRGVWRSSSHRGGGATNSSSQKMKRVLNARGERRGSVRFRGGSKSHKRRYETEDDDDDDDDEEDEDDEEEEEDESDDERHVGRSGKEHRSRRRRRGEEDDDDDEEDDDEDEDSEERDFDGEDEEMEDLDDGGEDEEDEEGENHSDSETDPPVLLVSDLNDELLNGSYLTVTLQRPAKAKRDPGAIVPKLEAAMSPRTPVHKLRQKNGSSLTAGNGLSQPKAVLSSGRPKRSSHNGQERDTVSPSSTSSRSSVSPPPPPPSATGSSPPSLLSHPSFRDVGNEPGCEKEVWVSVFRYLSRTELAVCMRVCKAWYKWSFDKRLWNRIDLSRCRSVSAQALSAIIKRQPVTLDLSWTPVSKKQITWLVHHLPGLKDLILSGCSSSCVSGLISQSLPCLRTLDLCWAEGVKESQLKDLISPPGSENRSRLRNTLSLRLSGLDVSDSILKLIIRHMPLLRRLDLSHCHDVTDQSVSLLTASGSNMRSTLREINLAGCSKLTDACLSYMKRLSALTLLDLRSCKGVTRRGCDYFISDLSYCTLFCLTEDKLIQRIS